MAKITRKQVDDINARLLNGWKFDTRHFMLNGEKSVTMEIPLNEKHELSASISFYDSYECFEKIGTVVKIRVSKWENIGNGMIRSCDWGKSRAIAYTKPRKMFKDIEILTAFITKENIMEIYNGTEETAEITNIRMNSKGLWERVKENSEPMPEAVAEITPETGNLKPTKKRINALQQIVKANKEGNRVAIQTEKAQFFGNGFMFVMLVASCFITPISEFFSNVADEFHHMARTFMNTVKAAEAETGEKLQLPTLQELKEIKRVCKLNDGKSIVDFGEKMPCVNADFLRKVLESLSGKVEAWKRGKYNIYLKDEYGNTAYIMGIQLKPEVKREFWKNTLERNRELEEELRKQEEAEKQENSVEESAPTTEKPTSTKEQPKSKNPKGESIMNENKNNTMPNGNHLDINGKEITTGTVVEIRNAYFKNDNGLYFVEHSPSDPTWNGTTHSLIKLCKNGKISTTKYNIAFYPLVTFTNSREKRIEAAEHNSKYAEIEIVDFSNTENIIAHFNEELAQQRKTSQHYGGNSDMCNRDKEIEEFLQSVIDRISGKSKIIDDNDIISMNNTENLTAENLATTEQPEEPKTVWTGKADYAERRAEKAERYAERAKRSRATADRLQKPINDMHGDIAFFTQPNINTSAGRAFTNQRNRMFASYEKGFEERSKAAYYDEKSENLSKEPTAISSDDPKALRKLKDKLEKLTAEHKEHLAHNKALKKAIKDGTAETNKFGWATLNGKSYYFTTNEAAEIRRLKDRIEELENLEVPENYSFDGGTVVFNVAENRVQILFDEIPDSETRENLKRNGFKWSPRQQAWQRMLNTTGIRTVKRLYPMPEKPTEENSVEETSQPTTENIVYPFILIDTPTAQPKAAEEKTIEEQPTENPTVAQPVITFDETLLNKARQMYYKVYVDSVSDDGINYIDSETEISGVRIRIIPSDSWDDSITFYSAEKFAEYMNEELRLESEFWSDEVTQSVEESATENHMTREEILQAIEEETKASINPQQILFYGEKLLESVVWLDGIRNTITEIAFWKYGTGADKDFEILTIEVDRIQQNILDSLFKTENQTAEPPIETITVEDTEIAVEKIPELGLKTDEEMRKTFNAVQEKINEVGTIEQKNIIYKIPWGIYRRYSTEDIVNVVLAKTSDILSVKTENRFKAVSALIADNMKKAEATAEQIAQAEIAIQYIGNPDKRNDYVFSKTYSAEENSADNSVANSNNTTAERKIRPPPFLKDFPKIRKEKR